jgi:hypothetical protein
MTPLAGRLEVTMGSTDIDESRDAHDRIIAALRGLRYGSVTAVVQDGVVVQVDRTEKFRVDRQETAPRR